MRDPICDCVSLSEILFFDLDEDAESSMAIRKRDKSLGIRDRGQSRFDADTHAVQQRDNCWSISLGDIDGGVVGQLPPGRDAVSRLLLVAFYPRAR